MDPLYAQDMVLAMAQEFHQRTIASGEVTDPHEIKQRVLAINTVFGVRQEVRGDMAILARIIRQTQRNA